MCIRDRSNIIRRFGVFLADDMIEYLGVELIPEEWPHLSEALLRYATDLSPDVRQAACYGIGVIACSSANINLEQINLCLNVLVQAINIQKGNQNTELFNHCRDNAIASVGKIIATHHEKIDAVSAVELWLSNLPLKHDKEEAIKQHGLLKDILLAQSDLVMGPQGKNLPQILKIFGEVVNTKYCDQDTKQGVQQFIQGLVQHEPLKVALQNILNVLTEKQRNALQALYSSN
eukprot:TRINITY_DN4966_c0_g1_i2.p1 TRINITY_DN4966_c0_g1~~TRINITY_DN4966_c0_g1_i2.p1  ORF type:complete len:232 (-),score=41.64 TRINITY_DN4966_c0_g1_i2:138-833(-)